MIERIYIKNFKYWNQGNEAQILLAGNTIFVGENDSGKSSVLQALNTFFNEEKIDKAFIPNLEAPVEIGLLIDGCFFKKTYNGKTFKESKDPDQDRSEIDRLHYIYLGPNFDDPVTTLKQLGKAQFNALIEDDQIAELGAVAQKAIEGVLEGANQEMVIINRENTAIAVSPVIKLEKAIDFSIDDSQGVPVSGRGSGFQKNLNYAMLVGNDYSNVILGIDEIENSFSTKNCADLLTELNKHIPQLLVTTHSGRVLNGLLDYDVQPLGKQPGESVADILISLGEGSKPYVLIEGKFDLPWFKKAIEILGFSDQIILLPAGGSNAKALQEALGQSGVCCFVIYDGDQANGDSVRCFYLERDCVELYTPDDLMVELYKEVLPIDNKENFFARAKEISNHTDNNNVKSDIAQKIASYLDESNPFVQEVKAMMQRVLYSDE